MLDFPRYRLEANVRIIGFWNFSEDIPLIPSAANPVEDSQRVEEEIMAFNTWRKFNPAVPFENLRYIGKGVFLVDVDCNKLFGERCIGKYDKITISILCPRRYPKTFPRLADDPNRLGDYVFRKMVEKTTRNAYFMCIPEIERLIWFRNVPHAGIAHYLNIFLIWYSVVSTKKSHLRLKFERDTIFV